MSVVAPHNIPTGSAPNLHRFANRHYLPVDHSTFDVYPSAAVWLGAGDKAGLAPPFTYRIRALEAARMEAPARTDPAPSLEEREALWAKAVADLMATGSAALGDQSDLGRDLCEASAVLRRRTGSRLHLGPRSLGLSVLVLPLVTHLSV